VLRVFAPLALDFVDRTERAFDVFLLDALAGFLALGIGLPFVGGTLRLKLNESIGNRAQRERT